MQPCHIAEYRRPSVNDLMDMVIIAVLEGFLFKWLTRYTGGHPLKPLPKIAFGMFFCTISCVCGGVLQVSPLSDCALLASHGQIYMDMSEEGSVSLFWQACPCASCALTLMPAAAPVLFHLSRRDSRLHSGP
jgi:hypothetical protein